MAFNGSHCRIQNAKLHSKRHLNDDEPFTQNTSGAVRVPLGQHGPVKKRTPDTNSSAWLEQLEITWMSNTKSFNFNISLSGHDSVVANKKTLLLLSVSLFIRKAMEKCRIFTFTFCKEKKMKLLFLCLWETPSLKKRQKTLFFAMSSQKKKIGRISAVSRFLRDLT